MNDEAPDEVDEITTRLLSLAESFESAVDAADVRTVYSMILAIRQAMLDLHAAQGTSPIIRRWEIASESLLADPVVMPDDDFEWTNRHPVRMMLDKVRDHAIDIAQVLADHAAEQPPSSWKIDWCASAVAGRGTVYLEAVAGYYREFNRFPDSYGPSGLDEYRDWQTFEWLQQVIAELCKH